MEIMWSHLTGKPEAQHDCKKMPTAVLPAASACLIFSSSCTVVVKTLQKAVRQLMFAQWNMS